MARTREFARGTLLRHPKGVKRYHNHEEADAHMRSLIADEMARRYQELLDKKR
ncbi:MAG TPA: hypothetical protein VKT70_03115 [Stellaceae bacterium]|nr:hypothetical protein [Stellaceae bacterium]